MVFGCVAMADWETGEGGGRESCPCEVVFVGRRVGADDGREEDAGGTQGGGGRVNGCGNGVNGNGDLEMDDVGEDDGVGLTIVIDKKGERSILVVLDGRTPPRWRER